MTNLSNIPSSAAVLRERWLTDLTAWPRFDTLGEHIITELRHEIAVAGPSALLDHLPTCAVIPERFEHDSKDEKRYSKYTEAVICVAFEQLGYTANLITARAGRADVEASHESGAFFAIDAKAFRASRTAKNQKDFKVAALADWAQASSARPILIVPNEQVPAVRSKIYQDATRLGVTILAYTHLDALVRYADARGGLAARELLEAIVDAVASAEETGDATTYWRMVERVFRYLNDSEAALTAAKRSQTAAIIEARTEGLHYLGRWEAELAGMTHEELVAEVVRLSGIEARRKVIETYGRRLLADG